MSWSHAAATGFAGAAGRLAGGASGAVLGRAYTAQSGLFSTRMSISLIPRRR